MLQTVLTQEQRKTLIQRLEKHDHLAAMWETVWLSALSSVTAIEHEGITPGGSKPDFKITIPLEGGIVEVVGDITAPSDKGLHERNPVDRLWNHIDRLAKKHRLNRTYFRIDIQDQKVGKFGEAKRSLMLPDKSKLDKFIAEHIEPVFKDLASTPLKKCSFVITTPSVALQLSYNPGQQYRYCGHAPYTTAYSVKNNPIYNALHAKAVQLRSAPADAIRLLIVCDAGCGMLYPTKLHDYGSYSPQDVAQNTLRKSHDIDLVMLVTIEDFGMIERRGHGIACSLIAAPENARHPRLTPARFVAVKALMEKALTLLPKPIANAASAAANLTEKKFGLGLQGALRMSEKSIDISCRQVMELLAGSITIDQFQKRLGWEDDSEPHHQSNPFREALASGRLITSIEVAPGGDYDDDWLTFSFGDSDAAISSFK